VGTAFDGAKKEDQPYGGKLVKMAKMHSSETYIACDDPLEAAVFSVFDETIKYQEEQQGQVR
jgi:hypothetical protein